jgi:hypothetical protein
MSHDSISICSRRCKEQLIFLNRIFHYLHARYRFFRLMIATTLCLLFIAMFYSDSAIFYAGSRSLRSSDTQKPRSNKNDVPEVHDLVIVSATHYKGEPSS